jgi:hypothetical protein
VSERVHRRKNSVLSSEGNKVTEHFVRKKLCKVCIEQGECQEGEKNFFSRNPLDLSLTKSQKRKVCVGDRNL